MKGSNRHEQIIKPAGRFSQSGEKRKNYGYHLSYEWIPVQGNGKGL